MQVVTRPPHFGNHQAGQDHQFAAHQAGRIGDLVAGKADLVWVAVGFEDSAHLPSVLRGGVEATVGDSLLK